MDFLAYSSISSDTINYLEKNLSNNEKIDCKCSYRFIDRNINFFRNIGVKDEVIESIMRYDMAFMMVTDTCYPTIINNNNINLLELSNSLNQDYHNIETLYNLPLDNK